MLNTIGRKLGFGFGLVLVLMAISAIVVHAKVDHLVNEAIPVDVNCRELNDEIQRLLVSIPAFVVTNRQEFKSQCEDAGAKIDATLKNLVSLSETGISSADQAILNRVSEGVSALKQTEEMLVPPATASSSAASTGRYSVERIQQALTNLIDVESTLEATLERKQLLNSLANSRGSLAIGVGNLRAYLLSGDVEFKNQYETDWTANGLALTELVAMEELMTEQQRSEWEIYKEGRENFESIQTPMLELRATADQIALDLGNLQASATSQRQMARTSVMATLTTATLVAIVLGCVIALVLSRSISTSVAALADRANDIASGKLDGAPLVIRSRDELGRLAQSFNAMTTKLRELIGTMASQEELIASEAQARAIFNAAADGLITISEKGVILSANPAAQKMFGYTSDELVGENVRMLAASPHREQHDGYLKRYMETGRAHIIGEGRELPGMHKDGTQFDIWLRVVELKLENERIFIGTIQDITARARTQAAIRNGVEQLTQAIQDLSTTTAQQAAGAEEQAVTVSQTVTTVEELRQIAEQADQRAKQMSESARRTGEVGDTGRRSVEESIIAMREVRQQVESLANSILELSRQAQDIGEITATVDDFAEQTNVLALNAAVEAARAGEHGRGFAVVANEVKSLAEKSKKETKKVYAIVAEIKNATNAAVLSTEKGTDAVTKASEVVTRAGDTIGSLTQTLGESAKTAGQISAAAGQQLTGVSQLNAGMKNIDQVTKETLSAIRQIEKCTQNLNALSNELANLTA